MKIAEAKVVSLFIAEVEDSFASIRDELRAKARSEEASTAAGKGPQALAEFLESGSISELQTAYLVYEWLVAHLALPDNNKTWLPGAPLCPPELSEFEEKLLGEDLNLCSVCR